MDGGWAVIGVPACQSGIYRSIGQEMMCPFEGEQIHRQAASLYATCPAMLLLAGSWYLSLAVVAIARHCRDQPFVLNCTDVLRAHGMGNFPSPDTGDRA